MPKVRFVIRCSGVLAGALDLRMKTERAAVKAWWSLRKADQDPHLPAAERSAWLAAAQADYEAEIAAGRLAATRSAVLLPALHAELDERGWLTRTWRPIPAGYRTRKARPWGTSHRHWTHRVVVDVPDDLGETLARACYWTSAPHIAALQRWYDLHGEQHRGTFLGGRIWKGVGPSNADLERRDELQDGIVTTAMMLRAAFCRPLNLDPDRQS